MTTTTQEVVCRDLFGSLHRVPLADRGPFSSPGSMLHQRLVAAPNEAVFVRKFVPIEAGRRDPRLYALLDNEIRAVAHLGRVLGPRSGELPVLAGYNVDAEEPFLLLRPYSGQPAAEVVRALDPAQRRQFQIGLVRALHLIASAGVVHGAVSLDVLRWNGSQVELVDFESAQRAGEPRQPAAGRWQSPERRQGGGVADVRDDVYSAGVLIRELVLGAPATGDPVDTSGDPERLRSLLDGVFHPVGQRPQAAVLLGRMRVAASPPPLADPEAGLAEGHQMFEAASRRKAAAPVAGPVAAGPASRRPNWRRLLFALVLLAAFTVGMALR